MARVLIVDDHVSVARSLVKLLGASGVEAHAVHSGVEALAFIRSHDVGLVFLDVSMPDMSGIEVLEAMRLPGAQPNPPPVVMFSGDDDDALRDRAARLGAADFVSKVNPVRLMNIVEAYARPTECPKV